MRRFGLAVLAAGVMCLVFSAAGFAAGQDDQKIKRIRQLFQVMHMDNMERKLLDYTIAMHIDLRRKKHPDIPQQFWADSKRILMEEFMKSIGDLHKAKEIIYAKHYSDDDIEQLIVLYESPLGQKMLREMPDMNKELVTIGSAWGYQVGMRAGNRLKEIAHKKGYKI